MLHNALYLDSSEDYFKASHGWLHRFKERHGIWQLELHSEALSADSCMTEPFKKLHDIIESYQVTLHQFFNYDETVLFWHMVPNKTLADSTEKMARNFKEPKEKITLLSTANASHDFRMHLLMVGKSKKPQGLKNINKSALPLMYTH